MAQSRSKRPKVVIVGSGFGGLSVMRTLGNKQVDVLLVDRNNYHGFWPLLYQVATGGLDSASIAYPIRGLIRPYKNVDFQLGTVTGVDYANKKVLVENADPIDYDYLVMAAGSAQFYFGNDALAEKTFSMKDVDEAEQIRNQVLAAFEKANHEADPQKRKALMTVAIVGGGPTGVELAGAYAELFKHDFRKDFPNLDMNEAKVVMIEATPKILLPFSTPGAAPDAPPNDLQRSVKSTLEKKGVQILVSKPVDSVSDGAINFKDGEKLPAETVIWAAGVRGALLADKIDVKLQRGMRVPVNEYLQLEEHPEVFIIGDMAYLEGFKWGDRTMAYPMVAQVAIQMGKKAAENIIVLASGASGGGLTKFSYFDKGSMAIVGRGAAIVSADKMALPGLTLPIPIKLGQNSLTKAPAWVMWLLVHVMFLEGWRNRWVSIFNWLWNSVNKDRGARVLTGTRDVKTEKMEASA